MSTFESLRLFFAVELTDELRQALSQHINELKQEPWGHRVSWLQPENLHITLRFLGSASPEKVALLTKSAHVAIKDIEPFHLQLNNIRFFPSPTAPRAITADIISASELFELAYTLGEVSTGLGFTSENKPYLPHLTLGRLNHHHAPNLREELNLINTTPMLVNKIVLFNSKKTESSQSYTPIEYIPLRTKSV